jgi:hypothetical protein
MYRSNLRGVVPLLVCTAFVAAAPVFAQVAAPHEHGADAPAAQHQHEVSALGGIPATREGSGTSWLPDESPMYALHRQANGWTLMVHGNAFLQYLKDTGDRGNDQAGSINWIMGMAHRPVGSGRVMFRGMVSLEPWTIGGCGYPNLLATGEQCNGEAIHDRQHQHDLFMELAAAYDRPLGRGIHLQLYGAPVGEPALGPVAFMHRVSALPNAIAPITHHWFDATHISFGVATAGVYTPKWKAEASLFNGREPDENRKDFDFDAMDSWSGRFWFVPNSHWAFQLSGGQLNEAESGSDDGPRIDVQRWTASATYHRTTLESTMWATTLAWGHNAETDEEGTNALLVESSVTLHDRDAIYGRVEWSKKSGHDLVVTPEDDVFTIAKLQGGYTRYFTTWKGLAPGIGAAVSTGIVPSTLESVYGNRFNFGFGVYLTLRPGAHQM